MSHQEACQLYIEQEIQEILKASKTPYSMGKELSAWVEKLFEAKIMARTIESKAYREKEKIASNEVKPLTPEDNMQIPKKQKYQPDKQPGPGRKPKYQKPPIQTKPKTAVSKPSQYARHDL